MRSLSILFLFVVVAATSVNAEGSHEHGEVLVEKAYPVVDKAHPEGAVNLGELPAPDVVPDNAVKVVGVPSETHAGRPIVLDKPNVSPTTVPEKSGLPSENVAPANSKAEKIGLENHPLGKFSTPKLRDATSAEDKSGEDSYTTKVPVESVAVAKKKIGADKTHVATATKVVNKNVDGSPTDANLPTISPDLGEKKEQPEVKLAKVPTEEIAVAHKKIGEETKVATATKSSIVAFTEDPKRDRRDASKSSEEAGEHTGLAKAYVKEGEDTALDAPGVLKVSHHERARRDASSESKESGEKKDGKDSAFTTKAPTESVAVVKKKPGEDKAEVATATKVENVAVVGNPEDHDLPTVSPSKRARRGAGKSSESKESGEEKKEEGENKEIAKEYIKTVDETPTVSEALKRDQRDADQHHVDPNPLNLMTRRRETTSNSLKSQPRKSS